jgi:hypothetical protein
MAKVPAMHGIVRGYVVARDVQKERVLNGYIIECGAGSSVRGIQALVNAGSDHVIVEAQVAHRGARREDLHPIRMGTARIMASGLKIVERLAWIAGIRSHGPQPRVVHRRPGLVVASRVRVELILAVVMDKQPVVYVVFATHENTVAVRRVSP